MLKYALVNDYNITEVFEITKDEMFTLSQGSAIFMCMRDTERLSNETPIGVLAFHPVAESEEAWSLMCDAIREYRTDHKIVVASAPMLLRDGRVLKIMPIPPPDPRLN